MNELPLSPDALYLVTLYEFEALRLATSLLFQKL